MTPSCGVTLIHVTLSFSWRDTTFFTSLLLFISHLKSQFLLGCVTPHLLYGLYSIDIPVEGILQAYFVLFLFECAVGHRYFVFAAAERSRDADHLF